ncbi:hypothetical protein YC2023_081130 [Brassica napus]
MISSRTVSSFDDQVEMPSGVRSVPRVQISRSSARYSAEKSEELPVQSSQVVHWVLAKSSPINQLLIGKEHYLVPGGFKETPYSLDREDSDRRGHGLWLSDYTTV